MIETEPEAIETSMPAQTLLGETMVMGVLGRKRSGKTLLASKMAYEYHLAGGRVLHMGNLSFGEEITDISILADQDPAALQSVLLYVDEVKAILNSRRSNSAFQQLIFNNLMQAGHQGLSMIWTTQFQAGVSGDLLDQCDYAIQVDPRSGAKKWIEKTRYKKRTGEYEERNLCHAWDDESCKYRNEHLGTGKIRSCKDSNEKRTIIYKRVTQAAHPLGPGIVKHLTLHCAQRFYDLSDTTHKIDALAPMLLNTDEFRARQEADNLTKFNTLIGALVEQEQLEVVTPGLLHQYLHGTDGMPKLSIKQIKSFSKTMGIKTVSSRDARLRIKDWSDSQ